MVTGILDCTPGCLGAGKAGEAHGRRSDRGRGVFMGVGLVMVLAIRDIRDK